MNWIEIADIVTDILNILTTLILFGTGILLSQTRKSLERANENTLLCEREAKRFRRLVYGAREPFRE